MVFLKIRNSTLSHLEIVKDVTKEILRRKLIQLSCLGEGAKLSCFE